MPVFNSIGTIRLLLESLERQTLPREEYEVIVVDGGSMDGTRELLDKYVSDGNFSLIKQEENLGIGSGRNVGAAAARSDILIFIDSDMEVTENWASAHISPIESGRWDGGVGSVKYAAGSVDSFFLFLDRPGRSHGLPDGKSLGHKDFVFWNTSIKGELFARADGFDEHIRAWGGEELELVVRIEALGGAKLRYNSKARAVHHQHRGLDDTCVLLEKFGKEVIPYLVEKHPFLADELWTRRLDGKGISRYLLLAGINPVFFGLARMLYPSLPRALGFAAIKYMLGCSVLRGYVSHQRLARAEVEG